MRPQALATLLDIKLSYLSDDKPGFKLTFVFGPNDFFENAELEKTYFYQEEVGYGGDFSEYCVVRSFAAAKGAYS